MKSKNKPGFKNTAQLAKKLKLSMQAIIYRARELGIKTTPNNLNYFTPDECKQIINFRDSNQRIRNFVKNNYPIKVEVQDGFYIVSSKLNSM